LFCKGVRYETTNAADRARDLAAVSEDQARGGIGSYLTLLQEKLAKGDFDKIAALVPGASGYLDSSLLGRRRRCGRR
jgi:hypothetical protein